MQYKKYERALMWIKVRENIKFILNAPKLHERGKKSIIFVTGFSFSFSFYGAKVSFACRNLI